MQVLRARLYEHQRRELEDARAAERSVKQIWQLYYNNDTKKKLQFRC
jgi:hypothetical protein